jgi:hypothetical protein
MSEVTGAIRIVDAGRQIFFVTCDDVETTSKTR